MTLSAEMTARLDTSSATAVLSGSLGSAQGSLASIDISLSVSEVDGAASTAQGIDLSPVETAVSDALSALSGAVADIPATDDLIAPIQSGIDLLGAALGGTLDQDLRDALDELGRSFDDLSTGSGLDALKQLADGVTGSGDLSALREVITGLLGLSGSGGLPPTGIDDLISGAIAVLESLGALMTLDTLLGEARKMADLAESHLPADRADVLMSMWDTELSSVETAIGALDPTDSAAVDLVLTRLGTLRNRADSVVEGLREGMAMGEATLTVLDPDRLLSRAEAVLQQLRSAGIANLRDAMTRLAGQLRPLTSFDLGAIGETSLDDLLTQIEAHVVGLAADIDGFDLSNIAAPVTDTLGTVTKLASDIRDGITAAMTTVTSALDKVRKAVEALPLDRVVQVLQDLVGTIAGVLDQLSALLGDIQSTIGDGAAAAQAALSEAETAVTTFRTALDDLFAQAKSFVEGLNLDQVIGETADAIQTVADVIGKADMAPYFDTAQSAIKTTAGVVDKVPFALLPDEMEQDLVDAIRPIKTVDLDDFAQDIKDVLQIAPDGTFSLRPELEAAVQGVQDKITEMITTLEGLDPRFLATQIDSALDDLATEIRAIEPTVALSPVTEALDAAKALVAGLDLDSLIQPLRDGFDDVLDAVDSVKPSALMAPIEAQVAAIRQKVLDITKLDLWGGEIDTLEAEILQFADLADPTRLERPLRDAFETLRRELAESGLPDPLQPLGAMLSGLLSGGGEDVLARSMDHVARWLRGAEAGADTLETLARAVADTVGRMRIVANTADPDSLADRLSAGRDRLDQVVASLPPGSGRDRLATAVALADMSPDLRALTPAHGRFVQYLTDTESGLTGLIDKGFGEVDTVAADLRNAFAPLRDLLSTPRDIFRRLGFTRFQDGVFGLIDEVLGVATPERLAGILMPVYRSLHRRLSAMLTAFLTPVRGLITELQGIVAAFDLSEITQALDAVFQPVRDGIAGFHPDTLLGPGLSAVENAQSAVADFDPLGPVIDTIETLQATITRVLALFDGAAILAVPITVYDEIMGLLDALDIANLLTPLYDRLDAIAAQVGSGLDGTVSAFATLQKALPSTVGSTSISANVGTG